MEGYRGNGVITPPFLTAALDGRNRSVSRSCRSTPRERIPVPFEYERYWVFGLCPSSGFFLNNNEKNTTFRKLHLFPSSGEGKIRTMDKVRKPNISVCYTPSSEPYSIYSDTRLTHNGLDVQEKKINLFTSTENRTPNSSIDHAIAHRYTSSYISLLHGLTYICRYIYNYIQLYMCVCV
jgi:hypothetical protein